MLYRPTYDWVSSDRRALILVASRETNPVVGVNAQTSMILSLLKLSKLASLACILSRDRIMTKSKSTDQTARMRRLVCAFYVTGLFVMGPYHCTGGGCSMGHILTYNSFFKMEINYNGQHVA